MARVGRGHGGLRRDQGLQSQPRIGQRLADHDETHAVHRTGKRRRSLGNAVGLGRLDGVGVAGRPCRGEGQ